MALIKKSAHVVPARVIPSFREFLTPRSGERQQADNLTLTPGSAPEILTKRAFRAGRVAVRAGRFDLGVLTVIEAGPSLPTKK